MEKPGDGIIDTVTKLKMVTGIETSSIEVNESSEQLDALFSEPYYFYNGHADHNVYKLNGSDKHTEGKYTVDLSKNDLLRNLYGRDSIEINYLVSGNSGPLKVFIHGVPNNLNEWRHVIHKENHHFRCVAIDMLNMGGSTRIINSKNNDEIFKWSYHCIYIKQMLDDLFPEEQQYYMVCADWGGGVGMWYATMYPDTLLGLALVGTVCLQGYPVHEIQAFGKLSQLPFEDFKKIAVNADARIVTVLKYMTKTVKNWDQYALRPIMQYFSEQDYDRTADEAATTVITGQRKQKRVYGASSLTLKTDYEGIYAMACFAAALSPLTLSPYHPTKNPDGLLLNKIHTRVFVIWGRCDQMMPAAQRHTLRYLMSNARDYRSATIEKAGHLVAIDRPGELADLLIDWCSNDAQTRAMLGDVYLGWWRDLWLGNERLMIQYFRRMYLEMEREKRVPVMFSSEKMPSRKPKNFK